MNNRREKMKEAQGGSGDFPKLDIARRYEVKVIEGQPNFRYYDSEKQEDVFSRKPIQGVLLGSANFMKAFDDDLGSKGGTYFTTPYFTNADNVAILAAEKGSVKVYQKLSVEDAEAWIAANTTSQRATKRKILYVLNMNGIVTVETNMTIAIDQSNQLKDSLLDNFVRLTPATYDPNDPKISKRAQQFLGKVASINPPNFANIELSEPITDEAWEKLEGDKVFDQYIKWKKFVSTAKEIHAIEETGEEIARPEIEYWKKPAEDAEIFPPKKGVGNVDYDTLDKSMEDDPADDLPF